MFAMVVYVFDVLFALGMIYILINAIHAVCYMAQDKPSRGKFFWLSNKIRGVK